MAKNFIIIPTQYEIQKSKFKSIILKILSRFKIHEKFNHNFNRQLTKLLNQSDVHSSFAVGCRLLPLNISQNPSSATILRSARDSKRPPRADSHSKFVWLRTSFGATSCLALRSVVDWGSIQIGRNSIRSIKNYSWIWTLTFIYNINNFNPDRDSAEKINSDSESTSQKLR